jgi:AraC family transcriptional regulator, transcriptional activator FtrA
METLAEPHVVAVLAYPGMSLFETGIVTEVFGVDWPGMDGPRYRLVLAAEGTKALQTVGGGALRTPHGLEALASADTVIIPSVSDVEATTSTKLATALQDAHARGARIASICSGAFALAGAGLLDGRRATTHWMYADRLRARFPAVEVDPHPLFIDHGDVLTSAGSASGLDLCLHLVRQDHGPALANQLARRLVAPPYRDGGQAQYIEAPRRATGDDPIASTMAWATQNLDQPLTLADLAEQAHMAPRTYLRHFTRATGTSPVKWLIAQRVEASLPLLEGTSDPIEKIATTVGFQTAVTYRHHFTQHMDVAPSAYRRSFRGSTTSRSR